ncbi:unnamed protein product [Orchesella dallaii]|uniref:BTB domain-containing protein n=1 Tax=Orchesella dallaii TaxID=48710 RepID=A0ABP1R4V7_9HEXA
MLFEYENWLDVWKNTPVKTHFQIAILNADGQPGVFMSQNKTSAQFTKANSECGVRNLITSANLADSYRRLIVNDTLKIFCQVWIHGEMMEKVDVSKGRLSDEQRSQVCNERLANDLGRMFSQSIATDVTVSTGKTSFKAHKTILFGMVF